MKYPKSVQYEGEYTQVKRELGLRIASLREEKGISQRQLSLILDLDRVTLNQIESGKGNPTLETLTRIASGLDRTIYDLFDQDCMSRTRKGSSGTEVE